MKPYAEMTKEELLLLCQDLKAQCHEFQAKGLKLGMSGGEPCVKQLNLFVGMMDILSGTSDFTCEDDIDRRNYGVLTGIDGARVLLADMMGMNPSTIIVYDNSSLNIMYDTASRIMTHGIMECTPWCKLDKVEFLRPVPGYDRHSAITEYFGIKMTSVPMSEGGPDMDMVEGLVASGDSIKGVWCIPKYLNPQGYSYSDETVCRFARLKPAASDSRMFWDNTYGIHRLYDHGQDHLIEILAEYKRAGSPDLVYKFTSTSRIDFPGSSIAVIATSHNSPEDIKARLRNQTIGHDKVNQLRHARFFKDIRGMVEHVGKHADITRPEFETVEEILGRKLKGLGVSRWTKPRGGYLISFDSLEGCAKDTVARHKKTGVVMASVGATYPYGKDPHDSNIRIAPTYSTLEDLIAAAELFTLYVKSSFAEKLLKTMA